MTDATHDGEPTFEDASAAVAAARRGFKRDVAALVIALRKARLLVPLARRITNVPLGMEREVGEELSLSPHLLFDDERTGYVTAFTRQELVTRATDEIKWTTDDGPLEFVALPSQVVLELALALADDDRVGGLLLNALDGSELVLRRHELASIAQGRPLPLVGYVGDIPFDPNEERLVAEMEGGPPPEIVAAIESVLRSTPYALKRTFNPERDLEPHLTLNVIGADASVDRAALARELASALDGLLPPPGYIDILFDDRTLT
ncbi:MAG TPA: SseB family protein [Polyangiaceae bacterium]|nr:SseB family protein [Polyangiaceae bacterium]